VAWGCLYIIVDYSLLQGITGWSTRKAVNLHIPVSGIHESWLINFRALSFASVDVVPETMQVTLIDSPSSTFARQLSGCAWS